MAKLKKLKDKWYITDNTFAPNEGSAVLFNNIPTYASFVDDLNELCCVNINGMTKNLGFDSIEVIVGSTNFNDNTSLFLPVEIQKAIAESFITLTDNGKYCVNSPDNKEIILGYFETKTRARYNVYNWFLDNKRDIISSDEYDCEYIIHENFIDITKIILI